MFGASLESDVHKVLKRHSRSRKDIILSDITLQFKKETVHIDHVYIGSFGILLVDVYDFHGSLYGNEKDPNWAYYEKDDKTAIKNPIIDLNEKNGILREIFAAEKIYKLEYDCAAVVPANTKTLELYAKSKTLMRLNEFKKYISRSSFDEDKGVNKENVASAIKKYMV